MTQISRAQVSKRIGVLCLIALGFLASCAQGYRSEGFIDPRLEAAFLFLPQPDGSGAGGAAVVIAPTIAATNEHNANLIARGDILARSEYYDLLFFRTPRGEPARTAAPRLGQNVVAYGDGGGGALRQASGPIEFLPVTAENCPACKWNPSFAYRAPAGPGFSGGPVVDAENGAVLGLTFGYIDSPIERGETRLMLAYDMALVRGEWTRLLSP